MPPEYIPLVTLLIGLLFQPLKDGAAGLIQVYRGKGERRRVFQFETLAGLADAMEVWRSRSGYLNNAVARHEQIDAKERVRILTFRVEDEELRRLLEVALAAPTDTWLDAHGDAVRRLGQVMREM